MVSPPARRRLRPSRWWLPLLLFLAALAFLASPLYPWFASWVASPGWWGSKPGRIEGSLHLFLYGGLAAVTLAVYLTFDDDRFQRFLDGLASVLVPRSARRWILLAIVPLGGGGMLLAGVFGSPRPPATIYQMHPTPPESFSLAVNPFRDPPEKEVQEFVDSIRDGRIDTASSAESRVVALGDAVRDGTVRKEDARLAYRRWCIEQGRVQYQILCRPCHGTKANGQGPQSAAFLRAPLAFTDPGTIQTLAEGAVFWRVNKGGIGMPAIGAPWDSVMPAWGDELSAETIWKIILAEYDIAGRKPRQREKAQGAGGAP